MSVHVTSHAIERCLERVDPCMTWEEARAFLSTPAIERAARFGAPYVRLPSGHRVVLEGHKVVTVLNKVHRLGLMDRRIVRRGISGASQ